MGGSTSSGLLDGVGELGLVLDSGTIGIGGGAGGIVYKALANIVIVSDRINHGK